MPKSLIRVVALLLVPCLLADPSLGVSLSQHQSIMGLPMTLYRSFLQSEALAALPTHFPGLSQLTGVQTSREYKREASFKYTSQGRRVFFRRIAAPLIALSARRVGQAAAQNLQAKVDLSRFNPMERRQIEITFEL